MKTLVAALAAAAVLGCGAVRPDLSSQAGPSPVVLKDTSAGQLAVFVIVDQGGYNTASRDMTRIDILFQHGGRPVNFVAGEQVVCAGGTLTRFTGSFEGTFPSASIANRAMTCVYMSGPQSASLSFHVPARLVILSPREHQQVPDGPHTIVTYSGEVDSTLLVGAISPSWKAFAQPEAITATGATVDTTKLQSGEGTISLRQDYVQLKELKGPSFQSVRGRGGAITMIAVVWV